MTIASPSHLPDLARLVNGAYRGNCARRGWTYESDLFDGIRTSEAMLAVMLANPATTILLHRDEAGTLLASVYLEKKGDLMYLGMLTVLPTAQARGLGKQMLREAETYARTLGCRTVEMTVITRRTELIAWYERRGYTLTDEIRPFPAEDTRFGLPRVALEFVVMRKALG